MWTQIKNVVVSKKNSCDRFRSDRSYSNHLSDI